MATINPARVGRVPGRCAVFSPDRAPIWFASAWTHGRIRFWKRGSAGSAFTPIASTSPSMVCGSASTSTVNPASRSSCRSDGPMEATLIPPSTSLPATASEFFTVDELVNVIQSGRCAALFRTRRRRPPE